MRALAVRVEVWSADRCPAPDAVLVAGSAAASRAPDGVPRAELDGAVLRVTTRTGAAADPMAVPVAPPDGPAGPPIPPHVRRRWRERLGIDPDLVVDVAALTAADRPTALAVAAAAVVPADALALALSLGCPTVARRADAAAIGAHRGEVEVVDGRDPTLTDARALAADDRAAARLSRVAAAWAHRRSPDSAASALLDAWGLSGGAGVLPCPRDLVPARLDELGTAPAAAVRARTEAALGLFAT